MGAVPFGFLNVNKPSGMTAHDVVASVRRSTRIKQIGHAGTLDPMAVGVLPVAVGKACRLIRFLPGTKTYLAGIRLGLTTTTDDIEGEPLTHSSIIPDEATLLEKLLQFRGWQKQRPPMYSAIHIDGKRLYQLARQGETAATIAVPVRDVFIEHIEALSYEPPVLMIRVICSAGTYIRSIARDLGDLVSSGACLNSLTREQAGPFKLASAHSLEVIKQSCEQGELDLLMLKPQNVLPLPQIRVTTAQAHLLRQGQSLNVDRQLISQAELTTAPLKLQLNDETNSSSKLSPQPEYMFALHNESIVAICRRTDTNPSDFLNIKPEVVIPHAE